MRFLIDNALSPLLADRLSKSGHDAVHVLSLGLAQARDRSIMDRAAQEDRILVSSDTDFGTLLALSDETKPSLILFRGEIDSHPERQIALILANLPALSVSLGQGCVAVFEAGRVRIRMLPILGGS